MNLANVNLYHLKYFYDVTQLSSFSKAAEANFVSRPAISKAILRLEEIIGYTLFDHEKKLVRLTKEGKQLAAQLEPILNQLERAIAQQLSVEQSLRLGVSYSIFKSLLLHPLSTFLLKEKNSKIKTQFGASRQLVSLLSSGEIDFAILLDRLDQRVFNVREFHSGHFILAASKAKGDTETLITTEDRPETLLVKHLHGD